MPLSPKSICLYCIDATIGCMLDDGSIAVRLGYWKLSISQFAMIGRKHVC